MFEFVVSMKDSLYTVYQKKSNRNKQTSFKQEQQRPHSHYEQVAAASIVYLEDKKTIDCVFLFRFDSFDTPCRW